MDPAELVARLGPNLYELYAVLLHSGGALGGHYYAYIKDLCTGKWFNFNDSSVTPITVGDLKSAYGGPSSYGGSSMYQTSANAYMLLYRRWDSAFSEARLFPEDVPEHVTAAVEKESKETEAQEAAEKLRLDTVQLSITYKGEKKQLSYRKSLTVGGLTEAAQKLFGLDDPASGVALDCVRLRLYIPSTQVRKKVYDVLTMTLTEAGIYTYQELFLETREPSEAWVPFDPEAITLRIIKYDSETDELLPEMPVMINQHKKLIDLKSQLEPIINIPASHQRMLSCLMSAGSIVSTREYFGDDLGLSRGHALYDGNLVYVEEVVPPTPEEEAAAAAAATAAAASGPASAATGSTPTTGAPVFGALGTSLPVPAPSVVPTFASPFDVFGGRFNSTFSMDSLTFGVKATGASGSPLKVESTAAGGPSEGAGVPAPSSAPAPTPAPALAPASSTTPASPPAAVPGVGGAPLVPPPRPAQPKTLPRLPERLTPANSKAVACCERRAKELDRKAKQLTIQFNKLGSTAFTEKLEANADDPITVVYTQICSALGREHGSIVLRTMTATGAPVRDLNKKLSELYFWGTSKDLFVEAGTLLGADEVMGKVFRGQPGFTLGAVALDTLGPASDWLPPSLVLRLGGGATMAEVTAEAGTGSASDAPKAVDEVPDAAAALTTASPGVAAPAPAPAAAPVAAPAAAPAATASAEPSVTPAAAPAAAPSASAPAPTATSRLGGSVKEDGAPSAASVVDPDGPACAPEVIILGDVPSSAAAPSADAPDVPTYVDSTAETFELIMTTKLRPKMPVGELRDVVTTRALELGLLPPGLENPGERIRIRGKAGTRSSAVVQSTSTLTEAGVAVHENCELSVQILPAPEVITPNDLLLCVRWWDQGEWVYGPIKEILVRSGDSVQDFGVAVASVTGVDLDHLNAAFPNTYMPPLGDVAHQYWSPIKNITLTFGAKSMRHGSFVILSDFSVPRKSFTPQQLDVMSGRKPYFPPSSGVTTYMASTGSSYTYKPRPEAALKILTKQEREEAKKKSAAAATSAGGASGSPAPSTTTASQTPAPGGDNDFPAPSGVSTTGEIIYEDAAALENEGLDDATLHHVLVQEAQGAAAETGTSSTLTYEQARLSKMRAVAAIHAAAHDEVMAAASREDEDAGAAAPLFDDSD